MAYHTFTLARLTTPDPVELLAAVRTAAEDPSAGCNYLPGSQTVTVKKAQPFTAPQITATQAAIEACPSLTPHRQAQNEIDQWPLSLKALVFTLIDQINVLRQAAGLPAITPQQALTAIRNRATTL